MSIKEQIHDLSDEMITNIGRLVGLIPSLERQKRENHLGKGRQRHWKKA